MPAEVRPAKRFPRHRLRDGWNRLRGVPIRHDLGTLVTELSRIRALDLSLASEEDLGSRAERLRARARAGQPEESLRVEAFALVSELAGRAIGLRPFDEQVLAGLALADGAVAEMATGEGKTLAAVFPAALAALAGAGVHVLTFNDYLARRDAAWMGPIYRRFGLQVGCVQAGMTAADRRAAWAADVTYATAKEAGFDFLRDGLVLRPDDRVHRPFRLAIVDEADSILIDEARIPLVIAGSLDEPMLDGRQLAEVVAGLVPGTDLELDDGGRNAYPTETGIERLQGLLGCGELHAPEQAELLARVHLAIQAAFALRRDVDYIVRSGRVEIVDEFTGRTMPDRHWPDGLQAAVEAKECLRQGAGGAVLGSITLQHFLDLYPRLCGMTATAVPAAAELREFYGLEVGVIPPHLPSRRLDRPDLVFTHRAARQQALLAEIITCQRAGRPVLVGTASVRDSEELAAELGRQGIPCQVLNARHDEREAAIVAEAGARSAVTISTNMAGRGTDIRLGGADEREREAVVALGGLLLLGTARHESRRIDDQLRGRAGRQGDPGETRFYVSLEDDLIARNGLERLMPARWRAARRNAPLDAPFAARLLDRGQRRVEGLNFDLRQTLYEYSWILEQQRRSLAERRTAILEGAAEPDGLRRDAALAAALEQRWGAERFRLLGRRLGLLQLDRAWAEHLAGMAELREGIHLESLGGRSPLWEYQRMAEAAFAELPERIAAGTAAALASLPRDGEPPAESDATLRGPSATWTYLVQDNQLDWWVGLLQGRSLGFAAAAAAVYGPLYLLTLIARRWFLRRDKT